MSLPAGKQQTRKVELSGGDVTVHGLTLWQGRKCRDMSEDEADVACIAWGTDEDPDVVRTWLEDPSTPGADARALIDAIIELSGIGAGAQFRE